jgi:transcription elongation GreA/GreB family factor
MKKSEIVADIILNLKEDLSMAMFAAEEAMKGATHDQSKAETQYDTLGLEHAYLAEGQSRRIDEVSEEIVKLDNWLAPDFDQDQDIYLGALLQLINKDGLEPLWVFLVPAGGGQKISVPSKPALRTITPDTPLGMSILGKALGDVITLPNGQSYEISQLS